jgi:hypothetical protein
VRKYFGQELRRGRVKTVSQLKMRLLRSAERGSLRATEYLLNRLCPEFAPRWRVAEDQTPAAAAAAAIVIRGGLSDPFESPAG